MSDRVLGIIATMILTLLCAATFAATVYALPRAVETLTQEEQV